MSTPIKIAVAESSVIIRSGIISVLKRLDTFHVEVFEFSDMDQLRNGIGWQKPDILIVNPALPEMSSIHQIKKASGNPEMRCVAMQNFLTDSMALKVYDEVISVYDSVDQIKEKLHKLLKEPERDKRHESLSTREKEVIVCVIKGMTNKQIADKLFLSTHTVITHRRNISNKLQIHSTAGLTIYAIVNKLVELDEIKDVVSEESGNVM